MPKLKKFLIPLLFIIILLSFTVTTFARGRRNYNRWWWSPDYNPRPTPTITATASPSPSPTPTAAPTLRPTVRPTVIPTRTPTARPVSTVRPTATAPTGATTTGSYYVTWYGWPDNDPAGTAIAYPKSDGYPTIHNGAGGIGTFDDPVTFAAKSGKFPIGTKLYVSYIKKYVILEDTCASCTGDWIDIWMESDGNNEDKVIDCEEHWTKRNVAIEVNPPTGREVSTAPIFNKATGVCQN